MKLICVILSFTLLCTGCYTNTPLTKDSPSSTEDITLWLKDGTRIVAHSSHREDSGYHVVGTLVSREYWKGDRDFDGIIGDGQIKEVVSHELDVPSTVTAVGLPILFCIGCIAFRASIVYTADKAGR